MTTTLQFNPESNAQEATDTNVAVGVVAQDEGIKAHQFLTNKCWVDAPFANEVNPSEACRRAVLSAIGETTRRVVEYWGDAESHAGDLVSEGNLLNPYMLLGESAIVNAVIYDKFGASAIDYDESTITPQRREYFQQRQVEPVEYQTGQWQFTHTAYAPEGFRGLMAKPILEEGIKKLWAQDPRSLNWKDWEDRIENRPSTAHLIYNRDSKPELLERPFVPGWDGHVELPSSLTPAEIVYRVGYVPAPIRRVAHRPSYEARISELRSFAEDDEDIGEINEASISDFWSFMEKMGFSRESGLVLLDNGNLRAVWRANGEHNVGLEFQGDQSALYVIFKRYSNGQPTERLAGIASFDDVVDQLADLDLISFVNG